MSKCVLVLLILCNFGFINKSISATDNNKEEWSWRKGTDSINVKRSRAELDNLLKLHKKWSFFDKISESNTTHEGVRLYLPDADLHGANLENAVLTNAILFGADLHGAVLKNANLRKAILKDANISNALLDSADLFDAYLSNAFLDSSNLRDAGLDSADLTGAHLKNTNFVRANLQGAILNRADLTGSILYRANLSGAYLNDAILDSANLIGAILVNAKFKKADLRDTHLNGTNLERADLRGALLNRADLTDANLTGADFLNTDLQKAIFEPFSLPNIQDIAYAINLTEISYRNNPSKLMELSEEFFNNGYKQQGRQIICALRRSDANLAELIFFDFTSEYGCNLQRPWSILGVLFLLCSIFYYITMLKKCNSGILLIQQKSVEFISNNKEDNKVRRNNWIKTIIHRNNENIKLYSNNSFNKIPMFIRLLWWSYFFSAINTFNIGFRDINFGRWLKLLTRKEFDLQPFGWIRVVSGVQALISVYLIALWVLSFVGTPFK